jgi:sugar phosphate isomerase/epimerase
MSPHLDRLAINQITTKQWPLADAIRGYARHGVRQMAVWRDKLAALGTAEARRLLADHGMRAVALTPVRVPVTRDAAAAAAMDDVLRAIEEAVAIEAQSLLLIAGPPAVTARPAMIETLAEHLERLAAAAPAGLLLTLEPLHPMVTATVSPLNTLAEALDVCDAVPRLGVAVDTYNTWWDPALEQQIARAGSRLQAFHVSDWLPQLTGDIRYCRGMMGDGCIDLRGIRRWMDRAGYAGPIEVEIFSEADWWKRDPDEVVRVAVERFASHC